MGDDFKGSKWHEIEPGDVNVPLQARFRPCSESTANDGVIPYASTLVSCTVEAHFHDDTGFDASTMLVPESVSVSSQIATAYLSYSTEMHRGVYDLTWRPVVSLVGSTLQMIKQFDYDRIHIGNR